MLAEILLSVIPANSVPAHLAGYIRGKTPISTWPSVITMTITYLAVVFGTREIMKGRGPLKLNTLFRAHNLLLSVGSLVLMALIGEEVISNWLKPNFGTFGVLCSRDAWTNRLELYLMINYYFKYYEFVDTIFLVLKKKPLMFLHVYHHAATAVLAFVHMNDRATGSWVPVFLNLNVHVIMYYYYYATAGGAKFWWKKHLTTIQIVQFVIILATINYCTYQFVVHNYFPHLPHHGDCAGTLNGATVGFVIIFSYLALFINFFYETYVRKAGSRSLTSTLLMIIRRRLKGSAAAAPEKLVFRAQKATL